MIKAVIMEINPFHNGHKYFLDSITLNDDDVLIAIISTNLCQRGELSVLTKDVKTKLLLDNRVDLVIELPGVFANQGGEYFAYHAINILNQFKIDEIICGSESNILPKINTNAPNFEQGLYKDELSHYKSNDILALSYLKAIHKINPHIELKLIKRISNEYNCATLTGTISSATSIRNNIHDKKSIKQSLPLASYNQLFDFGTLDLFVIFKNNLSICLLDNIKIFLSHDNQLLSHLQSCLTNSDLNSIEELVSKAANKNNPKNKIRRIIMNVILMIKDQEYNSLDYLRVLGFSTKGLAHFRTLNNPNIVVSLKNQTSNVAIVERKITHLHQQILNYNLKVDYMSPIKGE